jgi:hypothetical protein
MLKNHRMLSCLTLLIFLEMSVCAAQSAKSGSPDLEAGMQTYVLEFGSPQSIRGIGPSPLLATPFQCLADGAVFVDALDPSHSMKQTVYSLLGNQVSAYTMDAIHDLSHVQMIDYFPQSSTVNFLVRASRKAVPETTIQENSQRPPLDRSDHYFIAIFGRDGAYQKSVQLPISYPLFRFAALPSGEFIVAGYDSAVDAEKLVLLDDGGQLIKTIDPAVSSAERAERRNASADQRMIAGDESAGRASFVGFKDAVLEWRAGTKDPIIEIRADGSTREIPVVLPNGGALADILPSDDEWVAHVQPASTTSSGPRNLLTYSYYELSPLDGRVLRKLTISNVRVGTMACKNRGKFIAFSTDQDKRLVRSEATDR